MDDLVIFDTTLRDGEQSPGASMTLKEKVRIATALDNLGVDVIEAGFPISSPGDFEAVAAVAKSVKSAQVAGLCRARSDDIEAAAKALEKAQHPRIHTFISTSPIHMQAKLNLAPEAVLETAVKAVTLARSYCDNVEFSAEDAGRSDPDFLVDVIEACIAAGATTINLPDTVGYCLPQEIEALFADMAARVPNAKQAIFSAHCHNDLGLAVANSLAAVRGGARQVECTINGIGERAGNAALEEIVMAVKTRPQAFPVSTRIATERLVPIAHLVSETIHFPIQPNKAIVGDNAFAHESGIHQDGVLKARQTYEIMEAESVGWDQNRLVLGKHSGRHAVHYRLKQLTKDDISAESLQAIFASFKVLADQQHVITDDDLRGLLTQEGYAA